MVYLLRSVLILVFTKIQIKNVIFHRNLRFTVDSNILNLEIIKFNFNLKRLLLEVVDINEFFLFLIVNSLNQFRNSF